MFLIYDTNPPTSMVSLLIYGSAPVKEHVTSNDCLDEPGYSNESELNCSTMAVEAGGLMRQCSSSNKNSRLGFVSSLMDRLGHPASGTLESFLMIFKGKIFLSSAAA